MQPKTLTFSMTLRTAAVALLRLPLLLLLLAPILSAASLAAFGSEHTSSRSSRRHLLSDMPPAASPALHSATASPPTPPAHPSSSLQIILHAGTDAVMYFNDTGEFVQVPSVEEFLREPTSEWTPYPAPYQYNNDIRLRSLAHLTQQLDKTAESVPGAPRVHITQSQSSLQQVLQLQSSGTPTLYVIAPQDSRAAIYSADFPFNTKVYYAQQQAEDVAGDLHGFVQGGGVVLVTLVDKDDMLSHLLSFLVGGGDSDGAIHCNTTRSWMLDSEDVTHTPTATYYPMRWARLVPLDDLPSEGLDNGQRPGGNSVWPRRLPLLEGNMVKCDSGLHLYELEGANRGETAAGGSPVVLWRPHDSLSSGAVIYAGLNWNLGSDSQMSRLLKAVVAVTHQKTQQIKWAPSPPPPPRLPTNQPSILVYTNPDVVGPSDAAAALQRMKQVADAFDPPFSVSEVQSQAAISRVTAGTRVYIIPPQRQDLRSWYADHEDYALLLPYLQAGGLVVLMGSMDMSVTSSSGVASGQPRLIDYLVEGNTCKLESRPQLSSISIISGETLKLYTPTIANCKVQSDWFLSAGYGHTCFLYAPAGTQELYCMGDLSGSTTLQRMGSTLAALLDSGAYRVVNMVSGTTCACVLVESVAAPKSQRLYCWGMQRSSSYIAAAMYTIPTSLLTAPELININAYRYIYTVASSGATMCTITEYNLYAPYGQALACRGNNDYGQLGIMDTSAYTSNFQYVSSSVGSLLMTGTHKYVTLAISEAHSCIVVQAVADGAQDLYCWGSNYNGQLGVGDTNKRSIPERVTMAGLSDGSRKVIHLDLGAYHTCLVMQVTATSTFELYCWGGNLQGALGLGDWSDRTVPTLVPTLTILGNNRRVSGLAVGTAHTCILVDAVSTRLQEVYCWGDNSGGELGLGDTTNRNTPQLVKAVSRLLASGSRHAVSIVAGAYHTCLLMQVVATGEPDLHCWGSNGYGQLGTGSKYNQNMVPESATQLPAAVRRFIPAGTSLSCPSSNLDLCQLGRETGYWWQDWSSRFAPVSLGSVVFPVRDGQLAWVSDDLRGRTNSAWIQLLVELVMNATQGQRKATPKPTPSPPQISTTSQQILLYADPNVVGDVPNGLAATFAPLQRQVWSMASMFGGVAVTSLANGLTDKSFQDALVDVDWAPVLVIPPRRGSGLTGYENMTHIQRYLKAGGIVVVVGTFRTVSPFDPDGLDARELASLFIQAQSDSTGTWPAGFASYCNLGKQQDTAAYMYQHCCSPTSILVEESADAQYVAGQTIRSANWPRDTSSLPNMVPGSSWPLRGCDTASTGGQSVYMYDWTSETYGYSKSASAVHAWSVGSAGGKLFYLAYDWSAGENTAWGQVLLAIARMVYRRFGEVPPAPAPLRPPSPAPPPDNCNGDPLLPPGVLAPGGQTVSFMRYAEPSVRYDDVCSGRRFRLVCRAGRFYDATTNKLIDSESVLDLFPAENCYQRCNPAAPEVADLGLTADDDYDVGQSVSYTRYAAAEVAYDGTCQAETLLRTCQLPQAGSAGVTAMVWSAPIGKPGFTFKTCLKQPNPAGRH